MRPDENISSEEDTNYLNPKDKNHKKTTILESSDESVDLIPKKKKVLRKKRTEMISSSDSETASVR